jgi:hypothetical protein
MYEGSLQSFIESIIVHYPEFSKESASKFALISSLARLGLA